MKRLVAIVICLALMLTLLAACSEGERPLTIDELLSLGEQFLLDGDYEQALVQFMLAIEVEPMNPRGHTGAAEAYVGLGQYDWAREVLEDGLSVVGDNDGIRRMLYDIDRVEEERWQAEIEAEVERPIEITVSYFIDPMFDFDTVFPFSEGLAAVVHGEGSEARVGYINTRGEIIIPIQYNNYCEWRGIIVNSFSEGRVIIFSADHHTWRGFGGSIGVFDTEGHQLVPFGEQLWAYDFSEGLSTIYQPGSDAAWPALIDLAGDRYNLLADERSDDMRDYTVAFGSFSEGLARIWLGEYVEGVLLSVGEGFVNRNGNIVIPLQFDRVGAFSEGLAAIMQGDSVWNDYLSRYMTQNWRTGFIDREGNVVISPQFEAAREFSDGRAAFLQGDWETGLWGFIDREGNAIISPQFAEVRDFSDGLAVVINVEYENGNESVGMIDAYGNFIIPFGEFTMLRSMSNGLAAVRTGNYQWGFIDRKGNMVIEPQYSDVSDFTEGLAWVNVGTQENPLWGILQVDNFDNASVTQ